MARDPGVGMTAVVVAVLVMAVLGVILYSFTGPGPGSPPGGPAPGHTASGGIDYTVRIRDVRPQPTGQIAVDVELARTDGWSWRTLSVSDVHLDGAARSEGKLVSPLPRAPLPERLILEFLCQPVADRHGPLYLSFKVAVRATRHLGLSGASTSRSHRLPLRIDGDSEVQTDGSSEASSD